MIRVVMADDDLLVREGIQGLLAEEPGIEIAAVAADRDELLAAIEREVPDVVLTDIRMPPEQSDAGVEVAHFLRARHPTTGVIVISQYLEPHYALALLENGSSGRGYLLKDRLGNREQLVSAIEQVAAGGSVVDPKVVDSLVRARNRDEGSRIRLLTPRERDVLAEVATGKSNAAIGSSLAITKRAVERHVGAIFSKLNLKDEGESSRRVAATLLFLADKKAP